MSQHDDIGRSRYASLAAGLRQRVLAGEWGAGVALPAEQALAQQHQVALGTMRRALQQLVAEGLIERHHGRGTFVHGGLAGASMLRFFRFGSGAQQAPTPGSAILAIRRLPPPAEVRRGLGLDAEAACLQLTRLRSLGGAPCLLELIWLPLPLFAALEVPIAATADWGDLLYPLYAQRCGVRVHRAVDQIGFGLLTALQARRLGLAAGHPCAVVRRAAFDITGRCVEWRITRGDANAFSYTVTLN